MKNNPQDWQIILLAACLFALCMAGCTTQRRCWKKFPPQVKDSVFYREMVRDTFKIIEADSSMARYLVECEQTSEGYKARIIELLTQSPGHYTQTPVATINNNILTTKAMTPEREIHWQVKEFHYAAVKSSVYVKTTNILTGLQWFWIWMGRIFAGFILGYATYRFIQWKFFK